MQDDTGVITHNIFSLNYFNDFFVEACCRALKIALTSNLRSIFLILLKHFIHFNFQSEQIEALYMADGSKDTDREPVFSDEYDFIFLKRIVDPSR